jgi:signal transduction histidine kinase
LFPILFLSIQTVYEIPTEFVLLFSVFIPISYGLALYQNKLIKLETTRNKITITFILAIIPAIILPFFDNVLSNVVSNQIEAARIRYILIFLFFVVFSSLYRRVNLWLNHVFYGNPFIATKSTIDADIKEFSIEKIAISVAKSAFELMGIEYTRVLLDDGTIVDNSSNVNVIDKYDFEDFKNNFIELQRIINQADVKPETKGQNLELFPNIEYILGDSPIYISKINPTEEKNIWIVYGQKIPGRSFEIDEIDSVEAFMETASVRLGYAYYYQENFEYANQIRKLNQTNADKLIEQNIDLARNIHDNVATKFTGISYRAERLLIDPDINKVDAIAQLMENVSSGHSNLRDYISRLRGDGGVTVIGLAEYIKLEIRKLMSSSEVEITYFIDDDFPKFLPEKITTALQSIFNEGISNSLKHGKPKNITVTLKCFENTITLTIIDDGVGSTLPVSFSTLLKKDQFGIVGMSERAKLLNGTFKAVGLENRGFEIKLSIPYEEKRNGD